MYLPKSEKECNKLLFGTPKSTRSWIEGNHFAERYNRLCPGAGFVSILITADSLVVSQRLYDSYAYKLAFIIHYMHLNGQDLPFYKPDMVTSDQEETKGTDGMLNKIMLIGNLGRDPELNVTGDGTLVTKFSMAVTQKFRDKEETEWFNVVAWRQLAEICEKYLVKGSKVYIEGRLVQRKYTDRDGVQRTSVEVIASQMEMLTPKSSNGNGREVKVSSEDPFLPDYPDDVSS